MSEEVKSKPKHIVRKIILSVFGGIILLSIIGAMTNSPPTSKPVASETNSSPSTPTTTHAITPPATPQVLLDITGSGTKQTEKFTTSGDWKLTYTYDCSKTGTTGNFVVYTYNDDGSLSSADTPVNQLGTGSSDTESYYNAGTFYLSFISECNWHVVVKG
jgi:hypothetical protein